MGIEKTPSYLEKQNELYRKKRQELEELKEELKQYKNNKQKKNTLIEIEDEKETLYNKRIKELSKEYYNTLLSRYLDLETSIEAISYLISLKEQEKYISKEYQTTLYIPTYPLYSKPYFTRPKGQNYTICYLVKENKKEKAEKEIKQKLTIKDTQNKNEYYNISKNLAIPSDNYIQIAYYKGKQQGKKIEYKYNNNIIVTEVPDTFITSTLLDERYTYILEYIEKIIEYKLEKQNQKITLEEMKQIAENFIKKQKSLKK